MSPITNEVTKPDDATLIIRRLLNATPERAFRAWTAPEHIQQWMRPEPGMTVPSATLDLRVGGRYRIQMKKADGEYFTAVGEFREVTPPARLAYTWDWEKDGCGVEYGEVEGTTSLITVEFRPHGPQTEFILTHTRFATTVSRDNHARGWGLITESFGNFLES